MEPTHRLLHKFPAFRRRQPRHPRSEAALALDLSAVDIKADYKYNLPSLSSSLEELSLNPTAEPNDKAKELTSKPHPSKEPSSDHSAVSPRSPVPPYTPMPIPERVSSSTAMRQQQPHTNGHAYYLQDVPKNRALDADVQQDDISLDFSGFEKDLLHSDSSVSRRSNEGSRRPSSPTTSPRRGRSRPVTPNSPLATNGSIDRGIRSFESQLRSRPPAAILSHPSAVPSTLGDEALAQLQVPSPDKSDIQNTRLHVADDPASWDVIKPSDNAIADLSKLYSLEKRAEQLYSADHLRIILEDSKLLYKFTGILRKYRPWRLPILTFYLAACKAMRALDYANSLAELLRDMPLPFECTRPSQSATSAQLEAVVQGAFDELLREDLHYFITHTWIRAVSTIVQRRITGTLSPRLREASNGLAEVFCVTDPTRQDNPIILASEEFTRHSGCSLDYVLGRNCRFMQGPGTTVDSCRRFAISCQEARDHTEIFVNYRRDGSPFLSMVMNAPLLDSNGNVRYFLGAQVDVSGLLKNCSGLESLSRLINQSTDGHPEPAKPSSLQRLSEMLDTSEIETVKRYGGSLRRLFYYGHGPTASKQAQDPRRVILEDGAFSSDDADRDPDVRDFPTPPQLSSHGTVGNLAGVYKYYYLVRPAPSLRILFASPTLRIPGILQSPFLHRIGGSPRMRDDLETALSNGKPVTARVKWLKSPNADSEGEGKARWIHCTPLVHYSGQVGLWMVVVVMPDDDGASSVLSWKGSVRDGGRLEQREK